MPAKCCARIFLALYCFGALGQNPPARGAEDSDLVRTVERAKTSIVRLRIKGDAGGWATGFLVNREGIVGTAHHVIAHAVEIIVEIEIPSTTDLFTSTAQVVAQDPDHEIAVLQLAENPFTTIESLTPVTINDGARKDGESLFLPGYAFGSSSPIMTFGIISTVKNPRFPDISIGWDAFLADLKNFNGQSGGAVFLSKTGELIGILHGGVAEPAFTQRTHDPVATESGQAISYGIGMAEIIRAKYLTFLLKSKHIPFDHKGQGVSPKRLTSPHPK
jgi:S1-C subfamily serine protease